MKSLCFVSEDSIVGGYARSGIAEVVDSLAASLTSDYSVSVLCIDGNSHYVKLASTVREYSEGVRICRLFKIDFYLVEPSKYEQMIPKLLRDIHPDIIHSFADLNFTGQLWSNEYSPPKSIYTIDDAYYVRGKEQNLIRYDHVTTVSMNYATELLSRGDSLSDVLNVIDFRGITNGILSQGFSPETGLLLGTKYTCEDLSGKSVCKKKLATMYKIPEAPPIFIMMCRLVKNKGVDLVLDCVEHIHESGGYTIFIGKGDSEIEARLISLDSRLGTWSNCWPSPIQAIPILSGADFYLNPSYEEACGLMPMTSSRFGVIPITTLVGGLKDNMNDYFAITMQRPTYDCMIDAIDRAVNLYEDKNLFDTYRSRCMKQDFSWNTRKSEYLSLYES